MATRKMKGKKKKSKSPEVTWGDEMVMDGGRPVLAPISMDSPSLIEGTAPLETDLTGAQALQSYQAPAAVKEAAAAVGGKKRKMRRKKR